MSNDERLAGMRCTRGYWIGRLTRLSKRVTDGEASGNYEKSKLILMQEQLKEVRLGYEAIQSKMAPFDNEDPTRSLDVADQFDEVAYRIGELLGNIRQSSTPTPETRDSSTDSGPISVRLPEMHLPKFDGTADDWESFRDTFMSAIDRNDKLTPVQKLYYLRTSLTGIAAQHIQSLGTTDANYANALASLKEKFDNPRQLCMNHWHAIANFPKMKNSTPEAVEETIKRGYLPQESVSVIGVSDVPNADNLNIARHRTIDDRFQSVAEQVSRSQTLVAFVTLNN
ncbi:uncharacterized protein LOC122568137 [Bombus pyrosoma]|uniref:uncharacterized protein LOC122568137 n=1 Tax=Bombus pyrosoma TaxID=396416 RepID=UPI001CB986C6|nr:uncharacterized protein LOC122568137 [Bombus pyrosoma]